MPAISQKGRQRPALTYVFAAMGLRAHDEPATKVSRREQKRRDTHLRVAEEGLRLFDENGYDATTLEAVAAASGISARTLFYYFKTKYELLQFWHDRGFEEALRPAILAASAEQGPLHAVRTCLLELVPRYETEKLVTVDRIWHSTGTLRADKQMVYFQMEETVFAALRERWPQPEQQPSPHGRDGVDRGVAAGHGGAQAGWRGSRLNRSPQRSIGHA